MIYEAVRTTINDQMGYVGRVIWVREFYVGQCGLRKLAVGGGGLDGYFEEQGLSVGVQE